MAWARIWADLPKEDRVQAGMAHELGQSPVPDSAADAVAWLSEAIHVRPKFLQRLPAERRVAHLVHRDKIPSWLAQELLVALHSGPRLDILCRFFDACGFPHDKAAPRDGSEEVVLPGEALKRGIAALTNEDNTTVTLLLDCLESTEFPAWRNLNAAREAVLSPVGAMELQANAAASGSETAGNGQTVSEAAPPAAAQERRVRGFTTLDILLIDAALSATAGQVGALDPDSVYDLVSEVMDLNFKRQQSWFHLGFLDVLQGRNVDPNRPEANEERREWYLAGAMSALARHGESTEIVALARAHADRVRCLLGPRSPAVHLVASIIFEAHVKAGVPAEGLRLFSTGAVVAAGWSLARLMLTAATNLLHEYRAAEAAPLLYMLHEAVLQWPVEEDPLPSEFLADLERRRAHALRLRGDLAGARRILESLLTRGASVHASRAHADLGLIASGHKGLAHVEVPADRADWADKAEALRLGLDHFLASVREPEPGGAHGDYCLAVMHLCEGHYERARPHLERALAEMQAREAVYGPIGTLDRVRFYLAVCLTDALDAPRAGMAVELLDQALRNLKGGVPMPLLLHAFENLAVMDQEQVRVLVSKTGDILGDRLLAAVQRADALHRHPDLLHQLAARMHDDRRTRKDRAADAEAVLTASRRTAQPEMGAEALDVLEELADDKSGRARLLHLLEDRERYDPAWTHVEARMACVRLLESEARLVEAQALLEELAHEALSAEGEHSISVARGYVQRIQDLGQHEPSPALVARIDALTVRAAPVAPGAIQRQPTGRVLFVGGNETQERYDQRLADEIRAEFPGVELDFAHTGWGSNWGRELPSIEGRVKLSSAVVVMQFVRTLLGRKVRSFCGAHGRPWVACTGHGYASVKRSLQEAVALIGR